jgi:isopropylmalate/homocitrate/citramalate synthase
MKLSEQTEADLREGKIWGGADLSPESCAEVIGELDRLRAKYAELEAFHKERIRQCQSMEDDYREIEAERDGLRAALAVSEAAQDRMRTTIKMAAATIRSIGKQGNIGQMKEAESIASAWEATVGGALAAREKPV